MKPPKASLRSLIKQAYKNRYDFDRVSISRAGEISACYDGYPGENYLGNVTEYSTERTPSMNIQLKRSEFVIFTFAYDK